MMKRPFFFANWKMNHGPTEARAYIATFLNAFAPHGDRTVAFFPPALSLTTVRDCRGDRSDILLGVQNIATQEKGAFTGENSAPMAKDAGAETDGPCRSNSRRATQDRPRGSGGGHSDHHCL